MPALQNVVVAICAAAAMGARALPTGPTSNVAIHSYEDTTDATTRSLPRDNRNRRLSESEIFAVVFISVGLAGALVLAIVIDCARKTKSGELYEEVRSCVHILTGPFCKAKEKKKAEELGEQQQAEKLRELQKRKERLQRKQQSLRPNGGFTGGTDGAQDAVDVDSGAKGKGKGKMLDGPYEMASLPPRLDNPYEPRTSKESARPGWQAGESSRAGRLGSRSLIPPSGNGVGNGEPLFPSGEMRLASGTVPLAN